MIKQIQKKAPFFLSIALITLAVTIAIIASCETFEECSNRYTPTEYMEASSTFKDGEAICITGNLIAYTHACSECTTLEECGCTTTSCGCESDADCTCDSWNDCGINRFVNNTDCDFSQKYINNADCLPNPDDLPYIENLDCDLCTPWDDGEEHSMICNLADSTSLGFVLATRPEDPNATFNPTEDQKLIIYMSYPYYNANVFGYEELKNVTISTPTYITIKGFHHIDPDNPEDTKFYAQVLKYMKED